MKQFSNLKIGYMSIAFIVLLTFLITPVSVFANSSYVLPYPSYMPGNFLYKPRLILNKLSSFVYFGDFGKFDYNLKESDHYLVEAKTLFEYKQYLLALKALQKSDYYFQAIYPNLESAKRNNKNISERIKILGGAAEKHIEVITDSKSQLPIEFNWTSDKSGPTIINFTKTLDNSIKIRSKFL